MGPRARSPQEHPTYYNECLDNGASSRRRPAEQGGRQTYTRAREPVPGVREIVAFARPPAPNS
jgi:hypothetical protein